MAMLPTWTTLLIRLVVIFHLSQFLICFLNLGLQASLVVGQALSQVIVAKSKHLYGQDGSILRTIDTNGSNRQ